MTTPTAQARTRWRAWSRPYFAELRSAQRGPASIQASSSAWRGLAVSAPTEAGVRTVQRRTVLVLSGVQVLGGLGVGAGVAVGSLLAAGLTGSEAMAGLASTANVVGAALAALPLVKITAAHGRRLGLSTGMAVAAVGAGAVVLGAATGWLLVLFAGLVLSGAASAAGLQARYAATDLSLPTHRARDLSIVVWATTVGAVAGPNLADPSGRLAMRVGLPELSGGYLLGLLTFTLATGLVWLLLRPDPLLTARRRHAGADTPPAHHPRLRHSIEVVRRSPGATLGLAAIAVGHTAMVSVMVMTPVHMRHVDVSLVVIGLVISVHILGMYALSPVVGVLADRVGRRAVIGAGVLVLLAACLVAGLAPAHDAALLGLGLFLLGLGWSCALVAGSTLLTESVPEPERPGVQGASDLVMNVCGAVGGALAGVVVVVASYGWLATVVAVPVGLLGLLVLRGRPPRLPAPSR